MTFTREMVRAGRVPSSRILTRVVRPSSGAEAEALGLRPRQPVVHLRRLRLADGEPIALESTILIGACAEAVMTADLAGGSLHETLGRAGFVLARGMGTISALGATSEDGRLLAIRPGDPLLVERRVIVDGHGRRIEATESRYAAERYGLVVQFEVEAPDPPGGSMVDAPTSEADAPERA
jgi:GntR family transcriptional regulator